MNAVIVRMTQVQQAFKTDDQDSRLDLQAHSLQHEVASSKTSVATGPEIPPGRPGAITAPQGRWGRISNSPGAAVLEAGSAR